MAAVGARQIVVAADGPAAADRRRLLAHARVERAADLTLLVQAADGFFELADDEHLPVSVWQTIGGQGHSVSPEQTCRGRAVALHVRSRRVCTVTLHVLSRCGRMRILHR